MSHQCVFTRFCVILQYLNLQCLSFMKLNMTFGNRLTVLLCAFVVGLFVSSAIPHVGIFGQRAGLWLSMLCQDVLVFVLPALLMARLGQRPVMRSLRLDVGLSWRQVSFVVAVYVVSIPALNWIYDLNRSLSLPDSLSSVEYFMRVYEQEALKITNVLLSSTSFLSMLCSFFIVAVCAAFGEEIFFRGAILGLCIDRGIKKHLIIWVVAFVFSFIHFQFFGFLPRLLLGAWLGYLMVWSRSLWLPVLAHTLNNGFVVVTSYMANLHLINNEMVDQIGVVPSGRFPILAIVSIILTVAVIALGRKWAKPSGGADTVR